MPDITWEPDHRKPLDAAEIEQEIHRVTGGGVVRMTLRETGWLVRALMPAAMCGRGAAASERDATEKVVEVLLDYDCPVDASHA